MHAITGGPRLSNRKQSTDDRNTSYSAINELKNSTTNTYFIQARNYESNGEYLRAVEYYLKITPNTNSMDNNPNDSIKQSITPELCENAWLHAVSLAVKFLPTDSSVKVTELVASRLASIQVSNL